jgi:hypothetical protein
MTSAQFRAGSRVRKFSPPIYRCRSLQKQNAGTHEAFRRLNYAFLTLVRKGNAKSRHSEILITTSLTRMQYRSSIDNGGYSDRSSGEIRDV